MADERKQKQLVSAKEERQLSRQIMVWVNTWPDRPAGLIRFSQIQEGKPSMALVPAQSPFIQRRYITGGYCAEYRFDLLYRIQPGASDDARLKADEALNDFADWASENPPALSGERTMRVVRVEPTGRAAIVGVYDNGDEDHQITINLSYEVF